MSLRRLSLLAITLVSLTSGLPLFSQVPHFVFSGTTFQARLHGQAEIIGDLTLTCDVAGTFPPSSAFTVVYAPVFGIVNSNAGTFTVASGQGSNARTAHVESEPATTAILIGSATLNKTNPNSFSVIVSGSAAVGDIIRIMGIRVNIGEANLPSGTQITGTILGTPPNVFQIDNVSSFAAALALDEITVTVTPAVPLVFCQPTICRTGTITIQENFPLALTTVVDENDIQHKPTDPGAKFASMGTQLKILVANIPPGVMVSWPLSVTQGTMLLSLFGSETSFTNTSTTDVASTSFTYNVSIDDQAMQATINIPLTFCAAQVPYPAVAATTTAQVLLGPNAGTGFKSEIPSSEILSFVPNPLNSPAEAIEVLAGPPCGPSLSLEDFSLSPDNGPAGVSTVAGFNVLNSGPGTASPLTIDFRLNSSTSTVTTNDALLARISSPVLGPGSSFSASQGLTIPCTLSPGGYVIWMTVGNIQKYVHFIVTNPSCADALTAISQSFGVNGGSGSVNVKASSSCVWSIASNSSWITLAPRTPFPGNGTVSYSVAGNFNTSPRTGTVNIAGLTFTVVQAGNNLGSFSTTLPGGGGISKTSSGQGPLSVAYAQLTSLAPVQAAALANFGFTQNGILVSEVGVPETSILFRTRLFVDLATGSDSGVAIVNPNDTPMTINLNAKDSTGLNVSQAVINLVPRGHTALFVTQMGLNLPATFLGTLTLSSCSPFAVVNLRDATNGHGELISTALPLADLNNPPTGASLIFPQIVDGSGLPTQILLMNPSPDTSSGGTISLYKDDGTPFLVDFGTGPQSTLNYAIPPDGMVKFSTAGTGALRVGYAVVTPGSGPLPIGSGVFTSQSSVGISSQAGVPNSPQTTMARLFVEVASSPLSRNTGIAVVNPNAATATVNLSLAGLDGTAFSGVLAIPPNGHVAKFINELIPSVPANFQGVLTLNSDVPVSPLTLRLTKNQRGEDIFSTLPVVDLNNPPVGALFLPQIVDGGGFLTQLILLNTSSSSAAAQIDFFNDAGQNVGLPLQ